MSIVAKVFREGAVLTDSKGLNFGFPRGVVMALAAIGGDFASAAMVNSVEEFHVTHGRPHPIAQMLGAVEVIDTTADVYEITELVKGETGAPERAFMYVAPVTVEGENFTAISFGAEETPDVESGYASTFWTKEGLEAFATDLNGLDYDNAPSQADEDAE